MISTQYINLNMVPSGVMPVLHCSQYDVGRPLGVVIYNGSVSVDLSGYTVTIEGTRTDRTPVTAGVTTDGNIGVFTTTPTMTNENDTYRAKVVLTDNAGRVSSLAFVMCVDEKTMDENAEEIEEDASLYQQYTGTVQTIIAQIRGDLAAEITARQNAVSAEATARQNAISAEASARQAADNTLQSNINAEASTRATQDASLQSQINQLIAPSGSAPSAAEVENARIGSDGTVYPTLGDAIRTQNSLLKSHLQYATNDLADNQIYLPSHPRKCFNSSGTGYNTIDINAPTASTEWNAYLIPCLELDEFTVFAVGGMTVYAWAFIDASGNILSRSVSNATVNGVTIIAPSNAVYLVVNDKRGDGRVYNGVPLKERIKLYEKNHIFHIASGGDAYWSPYDVSPVTLTLGNNDYVIVIDGAYYTIAVSDILTAAASAGATVDYTNRTITSTSFVIYIDSNTHTPKVINTVSTAESRVAISYNPVVFAAHFKSIRCGMLVEYMLEKRIELAETGINALQVGGVPSFFEDDLSAKIPEIIANMNATGADGTSFVFITDLHWETNYKNSPALVKRVLDKTSVKNVFSGGDIINEGEKPVMYATFLDCINHFRFVPNSGFFPIARGNHDDNSNWSTDADITAHEFDAKTMYNLLYSQIAEKVTRINAQRWDFYFDHDAIKTRYIFLDTRRNGLIIDIQDIITCLNTVQTGWHAIFVMHFTLVNATTLFEGCNVLAHVVHAYNNRQSGSYIGTYQTATYDFTNATGYIDLIIGGHMHADYAMDASDANNPAGIPIIATDTDSYRNHSGTEGTVNSQCFDVVTVNYSDKTVKCVRIGRGSNRNFSY